MIPAKIETILFLSVTLFCWIIAAHLFWKWDIGCCRSEFQRRSKKNESSEPKTYTIICNGCGHPNLTTDAELRECSKCHGHVRMTKKSLAGK